jgi:hypothetical protein
LLGQTYILEIWHYNFFNFLLLGFRFATCSSAGITASSDGTAATTTSTDGFEVRNASGNKLHHKKRL